MLCLIAQTSPTLMQMMYLSNMATLMEDFVLGTTMQEVRYKRRKMLGFLSWSKEVNCTELPNSLNIDVFSDQYDYTDVIVFVNGQEYVKKS